MEDKGTGHLSDFDAVGSSKIYYEKISTFNFIRHFHTLPETHPSLKFIPSKRWGEVQKWYEDVHCVHYLVIKELKVQYFYLFLRS